METNMKDAHPNEFATTFGSSFCSEFAERDSGVGDLILNVLLALKFTKQLFFTRNIKAFV